jgi:hypothetical protein
MPHPRVCRRAGGERSAGLQFSVCVLVVRRDAVTSVATKRLCPYDFGD